MVVDCTNILQRKPPLSTINEKKNAFKLRTYIPIEKIGRQNLQSEMKLLFSVNAIVGTFQENHLLGFEAFASCGFKMQCPRPVYQC